ncbi:MAG TPA: hypothetical protein VF465_06910 [Flavobacterium sp.]|uniref:hypothetical protein n=1 Tax=Flavobacterium sp. TaxID=239 RepID=UPI002ED45C37
MKKIEDKSVSIIINPQLYSHQAGLKLGDWEKYFNLKYVNTLIAMALNQCIKNDELIINGYLITDKILYLVVKSNEKKFDSILKKLENHIHFLLEIHKKESQNIDNYNFETDNESAYYHIRKPFFKFHPLNNEYLVPLITGKKVTLPYFDRKLEYLKMIIQNNPFCSAIDYSGALGPVIVTLLND